MNKTITIFLLFIVTAFELQSRPEGMQVISGSASDLSPNGNNSWIIESGQKTVLEWNQFSIANGEQITFQQADMQSAILNRIVGNQSSELLGQLLSNGSVFVINPNGVLIGPNARIECAGFIASTFDVLNAEFLNNTSMLFSGQSKSSVVNLGQINCPAGNIALLGRVVKNEGTLTAKHVGLAASSEILLKIDGSPVMIGVPISSNEAEHDEDISLTNEGEINALMVELKSSNNPYSIAIQHNGLIDVNFDEEVGMAEILAEDGIAEVSGTIKAISTTGKGGKIRILGDKVGILKGSKIDASGTTDGGEVLIGGDFQGKNSEIKNADYTYIGEEVSIRADSLTEGDGGKVICWSEGPMLYYGEITARGGKVSGDGGFVEVSGARLEFHGPVDTSTTNGKTGTLLLDPTDITISGTAAPVGGSFTGGGPYTWESTANTATIPATTDANSVQTLLGSNNVTINTATHSGGPYAGNGDITVSTAINWSAATTLSLIAERTITIGATITNTEAASSFTAISLNGQGSAAGTYGGVVINSALTCTNGSIAIQGTAGASGGIGVHVAASVISSAGTITFSNCVGGGSGTENYGLQVSAGTVDAPTITATTAITGGAGTSNNHGFYLSGTGIVGTTATDPTIAITATGNGTSLSNSGINLESGTIQTGNAGSITLNGTGTQNVAAIGANQGISISSGVTFTGGTTTSSTANITLTGTGGIATLGIASGINVLASITLNGNGTLQFLNCTGGGSATATQASSGVSISSGTLSVTGASGSIVFDTCTGGTVASGGSGCQGVSVSNSATLSAKNITATNSIQAGVNGSSAIGFLISNSTVGSTSLDSIIQITAIGGSSSGTGSHGIAMQSTSTMQTGNAGTITLIGTAGTPASTGSSFTGISISSSTIAAGTGSSSTANITLTGTAPGGASAGSSQIGVDIDSGTITHSGTGTLTFLNCSGGTSASNTCRGVEISSSSFIAPAGSSPSIVFNTCTGGAGTFRNEGVAIETGTSIEVATITATGITGGAGTSSNAGFSVSASTIGALDRSTSISITATGGGTTTNNYGILLESTSSIRSGESGTITLNGTGSATGSDTNHGIYLSSSTDNIQGTNGNIALTGTAGGGASSKGIALDSTMTVKTFGSGSITFTGVMSLGNPTITTGSGNITFVNPLTFTQTSTGISSGGGLIFSNTVDGAFALTFTATGTMTFNGAVGGTAPPTTFSTTAGSFSLGANITTAAGVGISMAGPITLTAPVTLTNTGAAISLNGTINGAQILTISTDSTTTLAGDIGETTPLTGLAISTGTLTITANEIHTSGAMSLAATSGMTTSTGTTTFSNSGSGGIGFTSGSATTLTAGGNLIINAPGTTVTFGGKLVATGTSAGTNGFDITINAGGAITMGGDIEAKGGAVSANVGPNGGTVNLESTGGNISVQGIDVSGTSGSTTDGHSGHIILQPALTCTDGALGCIPDGRVILNGNLTASGGSGTSSGGADGNIFLSATGRPNVPSIATVISSFSGNNVTLTGGNLYVAVTESISIIGSFTATFSSSMTLSNLVASASITLKGPTGITPIFALLSHGNVTVLENTGSLGVISREHVLTTTGNLTNSTTVVGNSNNIGTTSLSQSELETKMKYTPNSYVLDYDTTITPVSPTSTTICPSPIVRFTLSEFTIRNVIADAQLTDEFAVLNKEILDKEFFLEDRYLDEDKKKEFRDPLEYRKYVAQEAPNNASF